LGLFMLCRRNLPQSKRLLGSAAHKENAARTSGARPSALISTALLKTSTYLASSCPVKKPVYERTDNKEY
jgi:hypothetical protein